MEQPQDQQAPEQKTQGDNNSKIIGRDTDTFDWPSLMQALNTLLRLRTTPIGMKLFESADQLDQIDRLRRPSQVHTTCLLYTSDAADE